MDYSSVTAYLESLPEGIRSYPESTAKGSIFRQFYSDFRFRGDTSRLPPELAKIVEQPPAQSAWVPEVYLSALTLAQIESEQLTHAQFVERSYGLNKALLSQATYRLMFLVASPNAVLRGAGGRYAMFHTGSAASVVQQGERSWVGRLEYKPRLLPEVLVRAQMTAFRAALEAARAKSPSVELTAYTETRADFAIAWQA